MDTLPTLHVPALGTFAVLPARHEVMFRCGHAVALHPVADRALTHTYLRALRDTRQPGDHWALIDLRHVHHEVHDDMLRLQPRDHPGLVFYTLRVQYRTRQAFLDALDLLALPTTVCQAAVA